MNPVHSTERYGDALQSFLVDEVQPDNNGFTVSTVRYRQDGDRLIEIERHVANPEGFLDLDSAIVAAEASRMSYLQCEEEERAGSYDEATSREFADLRAGSVEIDPFSGTSGCNTRITYIYRDADNQKHHEEIVVSGVLSEQEQQELREACEPEGFIPEQAGMRALQAQIQAYGQGEDRAWHEIVEISITEDPTTFPGSASELLVKFKTTDWDPAISSYYEAGMSIGGM